MSAAVNAGGVPFFIVGCERSGTTLLMAMLGVHSQLAVPEVSWWYPRFRPYLHTYGDLSNPNNLRVLAEEMIFGLKTPLWGLAANPRTLVDEIIGQTRAPTFAELFRAMFAWYAARTGKPRWGEKTPHNLYFVPELRADFPEARFIHLIRDGRDVAVEQLRSTFGPRNAYAAALLWQRSMEAGAAGRAHVGPAHWLDIRYEELAARPEAVLRQILDFLSEPFEPVVLRHFDSELARRRALTRDHRPLGEPVSDAYVGLYRTHLSLHDQRVFTGVAGPWLRESGYHLEASLTPLRLDAGAAEQALELDARIRAATLDAPGGHIVYESYNDWLVDQREERRRRGVWSGPPATAIEWDEELRSGQRAARRWKQHFAVKRRYHTEGDEVVL